jgi:glycosyltransferase involved in cell wall biosynthesis
MRILVPTVSSATRPDGVSRHAVNLARCLSTLPDVQQVDLVIGAWQRAYIPALLGAVDHRLRVHVEGEHSCSAGRNLWYYKRMPVIARRLQSDLIHLTYPVPLQRTRLDCPVVVTLHDLYPYDVPHNFGYPRVYLNRLILKQCLAAADAIVCVSESTLNGLEAHRASLMSKASCVSNCVEQAGPASINAPARLDGRRFILAVSQHRRNKNLALTIAAFKRVLQHDPELLLVIVGNEGPETRWLHALLQRESLRQTVVLLHGISDPRLQWCYRHCELLLATSTCEGFGLPVAEAMLVGCPVVCSDIPAFRELGESYCHFVALNAVAESGFGDAIHRVMQMPRPQAIFPTQLSSPIVARRYMQLYRGLLAAPSIISSAELHFEGREGSAT